LHSVSRFKSGPKQSPTGLGKMAMRQQTRAGVRLCLGRAAECERLAELSADVLSRETYLRMASHWRALAADREVVEQFEGLLAAGARQGGEAAPSTGADMTSLCPHCARGGDRVVRSGGCGCAGGFSGAGASPED